ncbi:hypothetical protein [Pedobacter sp. UBA5917]|jgi:hypothetical protein|uniref:hypothetical protein n=1 Tax=Pedobacter sp. UBA5917 TaxID=1947061 RepID=UPI0025FC009B|nr:hypothetical protein [Pedobacter sp. UBA5917]
MKRISFSPKRFLGVIFITSAIVACKKNSSNEETTVGSGKISYFAKANVMSNSVKKTAVVDSVSKTVEVNWSYATLWVEKISLAAQGNRLLDTTIMVEKNLNIFNANALAGVVKLPMGAYKDVKVKLFCRKSPRSEFAFDFKGTFINSLGGTDSVKVGSSYPFEANLTVTNLVVDPSDSYKATFSFNLNNVLTGISARSLELGARSYTGQNNKKLYIIWKGGSADEPFYDQVIQNWQTVASVVITKE